MYTEITSWPSASYICEVIKPMERTPRPGEFHQHHAAVPVRLRRPVVPAGAGEQLHGAPGRAVDALDYRYHLHRPVRKTNDAPSHHEGRHKPHEVNQQQQRDKPGPVHVRPWQEVGDGLKNRRQEVENELQDQCGYADRKHHQDSGCQGTLKMAQNPPCNPAQQRRSRGSCSVGPGLRRARVGQSQTDSQSEIGDATFKRAALGRSCAVPISRLERGNGPETGWRKLATRPASARYSSEIMRATLPQPINSALRRAAAPMLSCRPELENIISTELAKASGHRHDFRNPV